jgi:hypothetical protein
MGPVLLVGPDMSPAVRRVFAAIAALSVALAGVGCSPACDPDDETNPPERYEGGTTVNGYYFSSSAHEHLLHLPGGKRYDVFHGLGFEPIQVQLYWSFAETGVGTDAQGSDKSSLALAAGNSALIQLKNEAYIRVKNDSCAEFWLLVVASGDPRATDGGGTADAGSD